MDEFRLNFENDKALAKRFQPVLITEPSQVDTVQILFGLCEKYEFYHKCRYTSEAIDAAVNLSARYIPDRYLPDKAIDLMDEVGSRACMNAHKRRKEQQASILSKSPGDNWQEIRAVQTMHEQVLESPFKGKDDTSNIQLDNNFIPEPVFPSKGRDDEHEFTIYYF